MASTQSAATTRLIPIPKWSEYHPWPSQAGLRDLVFHGKHNGFDAVIRRVGRRVLIDEQAFMRWVDGKGTPRVRIVVASIDQPWGRR